MPEEWKIITRSVHKTVDSADSVSARHYGILLKTIGQSQNDVLFSENPKFIKRLIYYALDTATGCFYTVGKGTINTQYPLEAQDVSRKSAAKLNSEQWALCLKAWNTGIIVSRTRPPSGQIFYSKSLYEEVYKDTLYALFETPVGSIRLF